MTTARGSYFDPMTLAPQRAATKEEGPKTISLVRLASVTALGIAAWLPIAAATARLIN